MSRYSLRIAAVGLGLALGGLAARGVGAEPQALNPDQLFQRVAPSVYTVVAADSAEDLKNKKNLRQGSAVAVTPNLAVTNCHVTKEKSFILLVREKQGHPATAEPANDHADICLLRSSKLTLTPVAAIQPYSQLRIGARVYAIGSPRGLDRSLSEGLISGLRDRDGVRIIQATAPISAGSSGGGLFDAEGRLIGITSFRSDKDSQLNFAVATDEFWPLGQQRQTATAKPAVPAPPKPALRVPLASGESTVCGPIAVEGVVFVKDKTKCITSASRDPNHGDTPKKHELAGTFGPGVVMVAAERFNGLAGFRPVPVERLKQVAQQMVAGAREATDWSAVIPLPYPHVRFSSVLQTGALACSLGHYVKGDERNAEGITVWLGYCERGAGDLIEENLETVYRLIEIKD